MDDDTSPELDNADLPADVPDGIVEEDDGSTPPEEEPQ